MPVTDYHAPWIGVSVATLAVLTLASELIAWFSEPSLGIRAYTLQGKRTFLYQAGEPVQKDVVHNVFASSTSMVTMMIMAAELILSLYVVSSYGNR